MSPSGSSPRPRFEMASLEEIRTIIDTDIEYIPIVEVHD
jgi:hypothetical protein